MDSGFWSTMNTIIQAVDPGHAILEVVRPALNIFRSETFAPDMSMAMILSALLFALYFRFFRVRSACDALRVRTNFLRKCTNNRIFSDNFYEFDLLMKEGVFLEAGWSEFVETCLLRDPRLKTDIEITVRPADFINIHDAEHSGLDIKWFHGLSAVYVGVGLLFTFAGLVAALYFSSAAINAVISGAAATEGGSHDADVQRALAQLLNTATFKFLTSIAGLGCSIALAYLDGRWRAKIEHGFDDLCRELERCTVMVTTESIAERQYRMLGEVVEVLKRMGSLKSADSAPMLSKSPDTVIGDAVAQIETVVITASQALAASFDEALARHLPRLSTLTTTPTPAPAPAPPPPQPQLTEEALAATLERSFGSAFSHGSQSLIASFEQTLTTLLVPALTRALEPARPAPISAPIIVEAPQPVSQPPAAATDPRLLDATGRVETAITEAARDLKTMVSEARGFRTDLATRLAEVSAAIQANGARNTALIKESVAALTARELVAAPAPAAAVVAIPAAPAAATADPIIEGSQQVLARLSTGMERLTGCFDQVEGRLAAHLAAFDNITRATQATEQAIAGSARALQVASLPLTRVTTELSGAIATIAGGVDGSVRALREGQDAGKRLADELRATLDKLNETWNQHEARFVAVDESVARIFASIIQHTERHGDAVRDHVVAIDTHLAHAVNSLAANIEALQEMTSDLTEAVNGTDRLATLISDKVGE